MSLQAPLILSRWVEKNESVMSSEGIKIELRLPSDNDIINKASLALDVSPLLASLTIWGTGMVEFIVVQDELGVDVCSSDVECKNEKEVTEKLDKYLIDLRKLIALSRE